MSTRFLVSKKFTGNPAHTISRMSSIFVYNGKGTRENSKNLLFHELKETVDLSHHDVEFITASEVKKGEWMTEAKAICFGGGYDLGFISSLGPSGMKNIRDFVLGGGSYLGICAGAYFACDFIEFDKQGPLEVVGERSLKFFNGKCIGPAFPGFDYYTRKGVHAVPLNYQNMLFLDGYLEGGGYFVPYNNKDTSSKTKTEVLGRYETLEHTPDAAAIVKCRVGGGSVVLSAVHLEFSAKRLDPEDKYLKQLIPQFLCAEGKRQFVFIDILCQLGIKICDRLPHLKNWL